MAKRKLRLLPVIAPSAGIEVEYRRQIVAMLDAFAKAINAAVLAAYPKPPVLAQDDTDSLRRDIEALKERWFRRLDEGAAELALYFATQVRQRSDAQLKKILRDAGFSVEFELTGAINDILGAIVADNVSLIRSIPERYLTQVEGMVMRSVQTGRDVGGLAKELREQLGVAKKRAALIAQHQNNMATAAINRARHIEAGITQALWMHSGAGKEPRPTHVANNGKVYNVARGWYDPDPRVRRRIQPGELINCRCQPRPIIPGFV